MSIFFRVLLAAVPAMLTFEHCIAEEQSDIVNAVGQTHYIVDLSPDSDDKFERAAVPPHDIFQSWHKTAARHLVREYEEKYGFAADSITSWAGISFSAYLDEYQVDMLVNDPAVDRITKDSMLDFSSALWSDQLAGSQTKTWGKQAVASSTTNSNGSVKAYVMDSGIGLHTDLNVIQRVWPYGNDAPNGIVGCYAHSTHVAGIVGAANNTTGVVGISPSAKIVSVSILNNTLPLDSINKCNPNGISASAIIQAIDWIKMDITTSGKVGVVNLSNNVISGTNYWASTETVGSKLLQLSKASGTYKGAFVAQSAGNQQDNACAHAYNPSSVADGIMVIGALDDRGQAVREMLCHSPGTGCIPGFRNSNTNTNAASQKGSNFGSCVDAWAPGNVIYSTFSSNFIQSGSTTSSALRYLSGTSMSAPMVTGLALHLAESQNLSTSAAIEAAVRGKFFSIGSKDPGGYAIKMPTINPPGGGLGQAVVRAEFAINSCSTLYFSEAQVGGGLVVNAGDEFCLVFDSIGVPSGSTCQLRFSYFPPGHPEATQFYNMLTTKTLYRTIYQYPPPFTATTSGSYIFSSSCDSNFVSLYIN